MQQLSRQPEVFLWAASLGCLATFPPIPRNAGVESTKPGDPRQLDLCDSGWRFSLIKKIMMTWSQWMLTFDLLLPTLIEGLTWLILLYNVSAASTHHQAAQTVACRATSDRNKTWICCVQMFAWGACEMKTSCEGRRVENMSAARWAAGSALEKYKVYVWFMAP